LPGFAAKVGIPEVPVTGAAHALLVPFWAEGLGKPRLVCHQASARGGVLVCEHAGARVRMGRRAVLYAKVEIILAG
jgi:predicted PhzF superfamily epimerase YddE/YHI9